MSLTLLILSKELTLLDKLYFFSVLASCTVKQSFQWTFWFPVFRTGLQRYALFFNFQIFLQKFSVFFISAPVFLRTLGLISHPFFKWECKGTTFYLICKTWRNFLITFLNIIFHHIHNLLIMSTYSDSVVKTIDFH